MIWLPHHQASFVFSFLRGSLSFYSAVISPSHQYPCPQNQKKIITFLDSNCFFQFWRMKHFKHLKIIWPSETQILSGILIFVLGCGRWPRPRLMTCQWASKASSGFELDGLFFWVPWILWKCSFPKNAGSRNFWRTLI